MYCTRRLECYGKWIKQTINHFFRFPDNETALENLNILIQKFFSKFSEIWSKLFILDPGSWFFTHLGSRIQGVKKTPHLGSGSTRLEPFHISHLIFYLFFHKKLVTFSTQNYGNTWAHYFKKVLFGMNINYGGNFTNIWLCKANTTWKYCGDFAFYNWSIGHSQALEQAVEPESELNQPQLLLPLLHRKLEGCFHGFERLDNVLE